VQRKAYATGAALVAVLAVGAVGCTGGSGTGGAADDSKSGTASAAAATVPPGTYRDLPEPCGTVGMETLRSMLPGAESHSPSESGDGGIPAVYQGEPTVTYDNDRRVGCRWKSSTGLGSRHLLLDFERVVSYDPAVSDDERAKRLYEDRLLEAGVPASAPSGGGSPKASKTAKDTAEETGKASAEEDAEDGGAEDVATPLPTPSAELAPRPLEGVGDAAYINDELVTADSGVHRDITLVFRTGNVIVTVEYEQWVADKRRLPDSAELQQKTRTLAGQLAGRFDD